MRKTAYDYGMMTLEEFLEHRNPGGKTHGSDSYSFSVDSMNQDYSIAGYRMVEERKSDYTVYGKSDKSAFFFVKTTRSKRSLLIRLSTTPIRERRNTFLVVPSQEVSIMDTSTLATWT